MNIEAGRRAAACVDENEVVGLLQRLVGVPSVTGNETPVARVAAEELAAAGCEEVSTYEFAPGRANAHGVLKGAGGGPNLILLGHLDTVHVEGWAERWTGTPCESPYSGAVVDGELYGRGAADQKAGIAVSIAAARAVRRAGLQPRGDVLLSFVGDEEGGEEGSGYSDGIKAVVERMKTGQFAKADFAIYTEPTQLRIDVAQIGFFLADVKVTGRSAYFAKPWLGLDAVEAATPILAALYSYAAELLARPEHPLLGKNLLVITGVRAGGYVAVPGECTISMIRTLMPGETLDQARDELDRVVRSVGAPDGVVIDLDCTSPRDHPVGGTPCEVGPEHSAVRALGEAFEKELGRPAAIGGFTAWSEIPFMVNELGIPGVYFAPGDLATCHTVEEHVSVAEVVSATRVLARFIAEFCGVAG
jgi:acetylornithine deacetylase